MVEGLYRDNTPVILALRSLPGRKAVISPTRSEIGLSPGYVASGELGTAHLIRGDLAEAAAHFRAIFAEAEADHDVLMQWGSLCHLGHTLAWQGDAAGAQAAATAAVEAAGEFGGVVEGLAYAPLAVASLAAGDVAAAASAHRVGVRSAERAARAELGQQLHSDSRCRIGAGRGD